MSRIPMLPNSSATTKARLISPIIFMNAVPVVRAVMRLVLIEASFANSQVIGLEIWKEELELEKPRPSAPNYRHEYQIICFDAIVELHYMYIQDLNMLQLRYVQQTAMWGFECSKAKEEWDMSFIARRRLELAQLNRTTRELAAAFEEKLQRMLADDQLFTTTEEQDFVLGWLKRFRKNFSDGVKVADMETAVALNEEELGSDLAQLNLEDRSNKTAKMS